MLLHIYRGKNGIESNKWENKTEKLYINCDRKNIALLTGAIIKEIKGVVGDKLQMKYLCEQTLSDFIENEKNNPIKNYQRNEKIVIYAEDHDKAEIIADLINQLRIKQPQLFSTTKVNPLIPKKYGFIGIGKELDNDYAIFPSGVASGVTCNDYMADIMLQSIVSGFDEHFKIDYNNCTESISERMTQYVSIFSEMKEEQKKEILGQCKQIFLESCKKSKVNTVYTPIADVQNNIDKENNQRGA